MTKWLPAIALMLLAVAPSLLVAGQSPTLAFESTPEPTVPVVIANEVLGRATPVTVDNPELALGRVTIMPDAAIPLHHHPGAQIGVVVQGTLTYVVISGRVELVRADRPAGEVYEIAPGETVDVEVGDALLEAPGAIHQGRNEGNIPVVIYLSTLFPAGAPRAILDAATPTP